MSPTRPRPSASLVLLRQTRASLEVFMLLRNAGIAHFGGALVFPGGCTDPGDADPGWRARCRRGAGVGDLALRIAAIREGFEESGVLLARDRRRGAFVDAARMIALGRHRQSLDERRLSFLELIVREDLELATDRLVQIGHWITPEALARRFDTVFYAARVPRALQLRHDGREAVASGWGRPQRFLADAASGRHELLFPTRCNLLRVASYRSARELVEGEARRAPVTVLPVTERDGDGIVIRIPAAAGYPVSSERIGSPRPV